MRPTTHSNNKIFNTIIVGLGNIGMLYDINIKDNNTILSHAKAIHTHYGFNLVAGVEKSSEKRSLFKKKYSVPVYSNLNELFKNEKNVDTAVISTSSASHLKVCKDLVSHGVEHILCEKPMGLNENDTKKIYQLTNSKNITLLVNYIRRFDPEIIKIRKEIRNKKFGNVKSIVVFYSGELWNIASHFINLAQYFLDDDFLIDQLNINDENEEGGVNFYIRFKSGIVMNFVSCLKKNFEIIDFYLITDTNIIILKNGGRKIIVEGVVSDNLFKNYKILDQKQSFDNTNLKKIQYNVFEKFFNILVNKDSNISTASEAYITSKILSRIKFNG